MLPTRYPMLEFPFLVGMRQHHQALIAASAREVTYVKRQRLFVEGESAKGCWLIQRGRVAVDTLVPGRGPVIIETLGAGDVAGWSWLVPPFRWRFGGVAVTDVHAVLLDTERLRSLAAEDPAFGQAVSLAMLRTVAQRLGHTRARLLESGHAPRGHGW